MLRVCKLERGEMRAVLRLPVWQRRASTLLLSVVLKVDCEWYFISSCKGCGFDRVCYNFVRNLAPVEGGERVLRSTFLPPFERACVEAGALSIMTAYSILDGVPAVSNARK